MGSLTASARNLLPYGSALAFVLVAALTRLLLAPWLGDYSPFLFFVLAILSAAYWSGVRPALVATVVALILGALFAGDRVLHVDGLISMVIFAISATGIVALVASARRSTNRAAVSDRHAQERSAAASGAVEELNLLIDGAQGVALYMLDVEGRVAIWNKGAERLQGWTEREVMGRDAALFYPADAVAMDKPAGDLAAVRGTGRLDEEDWRVRKDGSEFLASVSISALHDESGALRGFAKIVRDITDQRATEVALKANEEHLRSILSTVPDAMVVIDEHGLILSFSAAAEQLFGYTEAEVVGTAVSRLMPPEDGDGQDDFVSRYLRTGQRPSAGAGRAVFAMKKDGTVFPMELSVGEAVTRGQRIFTGFVRDLTERRETEARMQSLQSELIHVSRVSAMGTMASTLAHELNQPITAVANYMEGARALLLDPDPEQMPMIREALGDAAKEAMRAGEIVRRLRDFVARGEVAKTIVALPELIDETATLALMGAREKGVLARFDIDPLASPVLADRVQIQQVLINLIRNALDAMSGSERREVLVTSRADQPGFVRVSVADTGPGILGDVADRLFTAFVSTKTEGMGLGLSICRTIVEAHGGKIWVEPRPGGGSQFHFTLMRAEEDEDYGG
jgi:two-component system, LuxR family, sensor kinase FixL